MMTRRGRRRRVTRKTAGARQENRWTSAAVPTNAMTTPLGRVNATHKFEFARQTVLQPVAKRFVMTVNYYLSGICIIAR